MSDKIHIGTRKGFFTFGRKGAGWDQVFPEFPGVPVPMFHQDKRDNTLYVAAEHEHFGTKFHRKREGESEWTELDPPVYPEKPDDAPVILDPWRKVEVPWSLKKVWSLESGGDDRAGVLWCGTIPGGLFKSTDSGESWALVRSLWDKAERAKWSGGGYDFPGIHSICVHPENSDVISVGVSCGGVWRTCDGGLTWEQSAHGMRYDFLPEEQGGADPETQDPHRIVQCQADPKRFWTQHHCFIYRSDDEGRSWKEFSEVSPSAFGFAVAVHPAEPDTAWFVPAKKDEERYPVDGKFVVTRTRDGGQTFETLDEGLPSGLAYDLVYRHALSVDDTGNCLVMGSTTGSVWVSEDQGDSWSEITSHLPPVYCVAYGR